MTPASAKIKQWYTYPVSFVREVLGAVPDDWQIEALEAFGNPALQRIAMKSCAGPGKSAVLAWCAWNFLMCYGAIGHHPLGAAMSVTQDNLRDNLWKELAVWHNRSPLLQRCFEWTKEKIFSREHPETWYIAARTWSKKANPEEQGRTLSGLHSKYILYLIDESGDISPQVLRACEQGLSNCKWGKIVTAGNPTSQAGILYQASTGQRHLWRLISITGDPDDPKRSSRVDSKWAREQIRLYGRDNPWVMAYILGQFPPTDINALLGIEDIEASMRRHLTADKYEWSQKRLGVDVARFGDDRTVIFPRQGLAAFQPVVMRNVRTTDIAARVLKAKADWKSELEFVDDSGHWGHGVIDNLITAGHSPVAVLFEDTKVCDSRYFNKRAEMWMTMAEWVKRGAALPLIPEMVRELTMPTYTFFNGKFRLEEKDQIKKRLGSSPDLGDALALTFAYPDMPAKGSMEENMRNKIMSDWNPFDEDRLAVST